MLLLTRNPQAAGRGAHDAASPITASGLGGSGALRWTLVIADERGSLYSLSKLFLAG